MRRSLSLLPDERCAWRQLEQAEREATAQACRAAELATELALARQAQEAAAAALQRAPVTGRPDLAAWDGQAGSRPDSGSDVAC